MAVAALAGTGGVAWRAGRQHVLDPFSGPAFEPWREWRTRIERDGARGLVAAAILASSPHNTQPWSFEIGADRVDVIADMRRKLGPFDPFLRELHIGLGAAMENLVLAAGLVGLGVEPSWLPAPERPEHVARLRISGPPAAFPPWATFLGRRHVNRAPYDGRPLSADQRSALEACVPEGGPMLTLIAASSDAGRRFAGETLEATHFIVEDPEMSRVTSAWMRHQWGEIQRHRDGLTLACAGLDPALRVLATLAPPAPASSIHSGWLRNTDDGLRSSPVYGLLSVRAPGDRREQLEVGRLWQRLHVRATSLGLSAQPLNQWMERCDRESQLGKPPSSAEQIPRALGRSDLSPAFAFRLGVASRGAWPSPRRPVEDVTRVAPR